MAYENDRSNPSASFLDEDSLILARLLKRNCRIIGPIFLALALVLFLVISVFGPANRYLRLFVLVPPIWLIMGIGFFVMSYLQPTHLLPGETNNGEKGAEAGQTVRSLFRGFSQ